MLKDEIKEFFEVVKDNSKLESCLNNKYIQLYLKVINDRFLNFPKLNLSNIVCFGYPNNEYLEKRLTNFEKLVEEIKNSTQPFVENRIRDFLSSCHSDDSIQENEYKVFYYIFNKTKIIKEKQTKNKLEFPNRFVVIPYGTFVDISKNGNKYFISSSMNLNIEWLKIKTKKDFKARVIVGVKWNENDINYFNSEKAKWINELVFGSKKENSIVHILKISDSDVLKDFEKNEIEINVLDSISISSKEQAIRKFNKFKKLGYRGLLCRKHIYTDDEFDIKNFEVHKG